MGFEYREFLCHHNPQGYNGVCNDEGGNVCPEGGCKRAMLEIKEKSITSRTLVIGDIHGAFEALMQVLDRSEYSPSYDRLIVLGDVVDGWPEVFECISFLNKQPNLIYILGNHDEWAMNFLKFGSRPDIWMKQGGTVTVDSFRQAIAVDQMNNRMLIEFFNKGFFFFEDDSNRAYVHGGFCPNVELCKQHRDLLMWDRYLIIEAMKSSGNLTGYDNVFIGHTTTEHINKTTEPIIANEVINIDTGAGWSGKLTVMDADTKEFWQSDLVRELYPNIKGRDF